MKEGKTYESVFHQTSKWNIGTWSKNGELNDLFFPVPPPPIPICGGKILKDLLWIKHGNNKSTKVLHESKFLILFHIGDVLFITYSLVSGQWFYLFFSVGHYPFSFWWCSRPDVFRHYPTSYFVGCLLCRDHRFQHESEMKKKIVRHEIA